MRSHFETSGRISRIIPLICHPQMAVLLLFLPGVAAAMGTPDVPGLPLTIFRRGQRHILIPQRKSLRDTLQSCVHPCDGGMLFT